MMVFMPLFVVFIGQFGREVIGHQDIKVAVIGGLDAFIVCRSLSVLFV